MYSKVIAMEVKVVFWFFFPPIFLVLQIASISQTYNIQIFGRKSTMESENICNMKQEETQENIMSQKSRENGFNMDGWEDVWMGGQINRWKECSSITSATKEKKDDNRWPIGNGEQKTKGE